MIPPGAPLDEQVFVSATGRKPADGSYHRAAAAGLSGLSPGGVLAALGIATVVAASVLERHHRTLAAHVIELRSRIGGWSH